MSFPIVDEAPTASVGKCPSSDGYNASNSIPLALVQQGVAHIILYSTLSTLLFVLLCVVLMKDGLSPSKRRTPVVWLLGLAMLLGVIGSALDTVFWATQMLWTTSSSAQTASYYVASNSMLFIVPWVVRWAMCLRIASFYPVTLAGRRKRLTVIALPTAMQILDLVAFCIVLHDGFDAIETAGQDDGKLTLSLSEKPLPYRLMVNLLAYGAALVSSIYINIFMIRKFTTLRGGASRGSPTLATPPRNLSWAKQQQLLFGIAFSYITPTLFLVSLIVIFCTVQGRALGFMLVCNVYVHVFSGTLACLSAWANIGGNLSGGSTYYPKHAEGERQVSIGDVSALSGRSGSRSASLAQTASGIGLGSNGGNLATVGQLRRHCDNGSGLSPPKQDGVVVAGGTSVAPFHNAARLNDSNMLLAVEPSSGVTLHNNVLSVPKSLPSLWSCQPNHQEKYLKHFPRHRLRFHHVR
ncbi:hypothetical protein K437DRAFT_132990 [Tilletiaria anomala UBC 951]|uniref:Uncharacterized protein n=1 Tax=Tilletiaria anomala (strain ATCC 24038 / CBS 436.72 / UBC 951) TaxID=1037660 RepID=A0A066WG53_TILAU|nr:uncharacterized protein K437DRAFT_132990 [Tilletiaria anomala UBC 951]KDN52942.1 hypothetical protein K437DRAFT_132990 [Tilletiaria anomala UBC 951]